MFKHFLTLDVLSIQRVIVGSTRVELLSVRSEAISILINHRETHGVSLVESRVVVRIWLMSDGVHFFE